MARLNAASNFIVTVLTVAICLVCFISHGHLANAAECHSDTVTVATSSSAAGSCASIGYSTKCCPPEGDCTVIAKSTSGSPCKCNYPCHNPRLNDCCADIFCPKEPKTCQDIGCCNDEFEDHNAPGCNKPHYLIGSLQHCHLSSCPQMCAEAQFNPGFCKWQFRPMRETCRVNRGNCYCDPYCTCFGDCCEDVQRSNISDTYFTLSDPMNCIRMYHMFEAELEGGGDSKELEEQGTIQIDEEVYTQYVFAIYTRLQEMWGL